jgi:hypothetical protein
MKLLAALFLLLLLASCEKNSAPQNPSPEVATRGNLEVTARLLPFPDDAIVKRELYNYAGVFKYELIAVHRGEINPAPKIIYIAHYNPFKPRATAADKFVPDVGGTLAALSAGDTHRLALNSSIDDAYMGGIVNKFIEEKPDPIYFALWTEAAR